MTTFDFALIGQDIKFFKVMLTTFTNSCNTKEIVDLPIVNNSLQTKKLALWANL